MSYLQPPSTPLGQRAPSPTSSPLHLSLLSPSGQAKVNTLKRKASDLSEQSPPRAAGAFLNWRLSTIQAELEILESMEEDFSASLAKDLTSNHQKIESAIESLQKERADLERELVIMTKQKPFIREDLEDSSKAIEDSYIEDIYSAWLHASEDGKKSYKRAMPRNKFPKLVDDYLGASEKFDPSVDPRTFCHILGYKASEVIRCAHIVPFWFDSKELSYMFGADDSALHSRRNGLFLHRVIEKGFNNGWIAIVPDGSVEKTPTEWKVVLLKESVRNDTVYTNPDKTLVRWRDIDGKALQFQNDNRPARRYLYFRYVMAHMNASRNGWPDVEKKLPSGEIWASPNKPDGYLRKSVLQILAKRIGVQTLPSDLVEAGTFDDTDPASGRQVEDMKSSIELSYRIKENALGNLQDEDDERESGDETDSEDDSA
ncbi:MAG: hypothetical protein Q9186_001023 [Xanthomendoza sp. 1 TL-2023]